MDKKKILVVEDDSSLGDALCQKLKLEGFYPLRANDGEEGIKTALSEHPDLILLDIMMPRMDGITALTKLRKDPWGKTAKVVILTNLSNDMDKVQKAVENEVLVYIVKSDTKIDEVIKKVRQLTS